MHARTHAHLNSYKPNAQCDVLLDVVFGWIGCVCVCHMRLLKCHGNLFGVVFSFNEHLNYHSIRLWSYQWRGANKFPKMYELNPKPYHTAPEQLLRCWCVSYLAASRFNRYCIHCGNMGNFNANIFSARIMSLRCVALVRLNFLSLLNLSFAFFCFCSVGETSQHHFRCSISLIIFCQQDAKHL